jgi:hypothetical protein
MEKWMFDQSYIISHLHLDIGDAILEGHTDRQIGTVTTPFAYPLAQLLQDRTQRVRGVLGTINRHCAVRYPEKYHDPVPRYHLDSWYYHALRTIQGYDHRELDPRPRDTILMNLRAIRDIQLQIADAVAFHNHRTQS